MVGFVPKFVTLNAGSEPIVLLLSKKPADSMSGYVTIEPFTGKA